MGDFDSGEMSAIYRIAHNFRIAVYSAIAAASMGVGLSLLMNLNKTIVLPFFPDIADAAIIMLVGGLLLAEALRDAK